MRGYFPPSNKFHTMIVALEREVQMTQVANMKWAAAAEEKNKEAAKYRHQVRVVQRDLRTRPIRRVDMVKLHIMTENHRALMRMREMECERKPEVKTLQNSPAIPETRNWPVRTSSAARILQRTPIRRSCDKQDWEGRYWDRPLIHGTGV